MNHSLIESEYHTIVKIRIDKDFILLNKKNFKLSLSGGFFRTFYKPVQLKKKKTLLKLHILYVLYIYYLS